MPVNRQKKLCFIWIPKTAGTSIVNAIDAKEFIEDWEVPSPQHFNLQELQVYAQESFADFYKFTVVREETSRMYSEYRWRLQRKDRTEFDFNKECDLSSFETFKSYVDSLTDFSRYTYDHFRPQSHWLNGLDKIYFFDRLDELEKDLSIQLSHLNSTQ